MVGVQLKSSSVALLLSFVVCRAEDSSTDVNSDAYLNTTELVRKYGYPAEQHEVISQDGYILTVFRIPHGKNCSGPGEPVLLQHGFLSDSDAWLQQEHQSLPFLLVDSAECYDVWLVNGRGNRYSRKHTTLDPDRLKFWLFSWHEQGVYDVPAVITYILNVTGQSSLSYVGHSMGTTVFLVMASERPELLHKVRLAQLLAPVCYVGDIPSALIRFLAPFAPALARVLLPLLHGEIPASKPPTPDSASAWANNTEAQLLQMVVGEILGSWNPREVNLSRYAAQHSRGISGGSIRQAQHYAQEVVSGHFRPFDFGYLRNRIKYGRISPPDYNLKNISCRIIGWYSNGDWLVSTKDVKRLSDGTPPNVQFYMVPEDGFAHSDYLTGKNAYWLVYLRMLAALAGEDIGASKGVRVSGDVGASEDAGASSRSPTRLSAPSESVQLLERRNSNRKVQKAEETASKGASSPRHGSGTQQRL